MICKVATSNSILGRAIILLCCLSFSLSVYSSEESQLSLKVQIDNFELQTAPGLTDLKLLAMISNQSIKSSEQLTMKILLSSTEEFEGNEREIGSLELNAIPAGGGIGIPWQGEFSEPPGTHWIKICVAEKTDFAAQYACTEAISLDVLEIDLATGLVELRPVKIVRGVPLYLRVPIDNRGSQSSDPTKVQYVLSLNPKISRSDKTLAIQEVPSIEPGTRWGETIKTKFDGVPKDYWIGACIFPIKGEVNLENNCSSGRQLSVIDDIFPDLIVETVKVNSETWAESSMVDFYAEVLNVGNGESEPAKVMFYLSENQDITSGDIEIGSVDTESIAPNSQFNAYLNTETSVIPGIYWLGACVLASDSELDTYNNCSSAFQVEVTHYNFSEQ